jgi:hypothetical protein
VLDGQVRLGDVEAVSSVIWLSVLRGSTGVAETMPATAFQNTLNSYFDCTAGAALNSFRFQKYRSSQLTYSDKNHYRPKTRH